MFKEISSSNILVTGAEGQLGSDLVEILSEKHKIIAVDEKDFDISDFNAVNNFISNSRPSIIIHTAAFTDVDECEKEKTKAFKINGIGTRNLSIAAKKVNAKFFYISTDYVFEGEKEGEHYEYDAPNPRTIYGMSKLLGENFVKEQLSEFFILRIAWLYGKNGKNFVKTMIELAKNDKEIKVVDDQLGSPTWTLDVVKQIKKLLPTDLYGTYHCTSQGSCTWFDFALEIFKDIGYKAKEKDKKSFILKIKNSELGTTDTVTLKKVPSSKFKTAAKRPKNSVLENYMLKLQNLDIMPHWKESLALFIDSLKQSKEISKTQGKYE